MVDLPGRISSTCRGLCAGAVAIVLGLTSACSTTTTPVTSSPNPRDPVSAAPAQPDVERLAKVRLDLASAYFARGQSQDALDEIKQLLAVKPDDPGAYGLRGLIFASLGDATTADESLRKSLQLAPHNGDTMHNYAWFLCQQRRFPEAEAEFAQALAEPTYKGTSRTLMAQGVCQARSGQLELAERTLSRAYELDPANPSIAVNLAEVLYRRTDYERAQFYIRRVNSKDEQVNAQTLWLAAQIERKLGKEDLVQQMGEQLHNRFPQAPETLLFDKGRFE